MKKAQGSRRGSTHSREITAEGVGLVPGGPMESKSSWGGISGSRTGNVRKKEGQFNDPV